MPGILVIDKVEADNKNTKISKQTHIIEQIGEDGGKQYNCTACQKVFRSRSQRYYHINCNQLHSLEFKCEHCDKSFARRTQWRYHTESHISPVNECQKCQKSFSNPLALKKHLSLHKAEPKVCPHCNKTFKKKISLDNHIAAQHLNRLQYGCAHCNKNYASKSTLQLHLQTHEEKRFECEFCGKLFQRNSILKSHLKRHNSSNNYMCTLCQKTFSESGALARHNKIHQESVLQYFCNLCEKNISRKDNMARHLVTIHPEQKFDDIVKTIKAVPRQQNAKSEPCNFYDSNQKEIDKTFLVIENKLLHEPFEIKESTKDLQESLTKKTIFTEQPLLNQIKVITPVPTYNTANMSQEHVNQHNKTNNHQHEIVDWMIQNQESSYEMPTQNYAEHEFKKEQNELFVNNNLRKKKNQPGEVLVEQQEYFNSQNEAKLSTSFPAYQPHLFENGPTATLAFPSVIKFVGNVKKDLTSINFTAITPINETSIEYKHKKYCRNNYDIDLYRKILGCDEENEDENVRKPQKCDHVIKSSTTVHWRKCFKNNYETSGSLNNDKNIAHVQ